MNVNVNVNGVAYSFTAGAVGVLMQWKSPRREAILDLSMQVAIGWNRLLPYPGDPRCVVDSGCVVEAIDRLGLEAVKPVL